MKEKINEIIERYKYEEAGETYYNDVRYDQDENGFWLYEELKEYLNKSGIIYELEKRFGCDIANYDNGFIALAYLDENQKLQLKTVVYESF